MASLMLVLFCLLPISYRTNLDNSVAPDLLKYDRGFKKDDTEKVSE